MKRKMVIFFRGGHVGRRGRREGRRRRRPCWWSRKNKTFLSSGNLTPFSCKFFDKNMLFWPCHVVANQKYSYMHYSVLDPGL